MNALEAARRDIKAITSDVTVGFAVDITLITPSGIEYTGINGLHSKHSMGLDLDTGKYVVTRNAHASIHEGILNDKGYPVRNAAGHVDMKQHTLKVKDSTGVVMTYIIDQAMPDETVGLITFILGSKA